MPVYLNRVMEGVKQIQEDGASLFQLLAFWASPFQRGDASTHLIATPGPLLLAVPVVGLILLFRRKLTRQTLLFWLGSLGLLLVSTCYFPWDFLAESSRVGQFLAQVQFPWRYVGPAALFLTLTLGSLFTRELPAERERISRQAWIRKWKIHSKQETHSAHPDFGSVIRKTIWTHPNISWS